MTLPNVDMNLLDQPTLEKVQAKELDHPPRILLPVSYTHLTLPTIHVECRSRWSPYH